MHPFLYQAEGASGPLRIPAYGMLILTAFVAAFLLVNHLAKRSGIRPDRMIPLYAASAVGGLIGARVLYILAVEGPATFLDPWKLFSTGGLAFYGGMLGGTAAVLGTARYLQLPGWKLIDILAPALVLGMGIGRLACFMAGCCHGAIAEMDANALALLEPGGFLHGQIWVQSSFPYVLTEFHDGVGRLHNEPLYPTQLFQAFTLISLAGLLVALRPLRRFDGMIGGLMLTVEPLLRIFAESYRADERGYVVSWEVAQIPAWLPPGFTRAGEALPDALGAIHNTPNLVGITTSQFIGLGLMLVGLVVLAVRVGKGVEPETPIEDEE